MTMRIRNSEVKGIPDYDLDLEGVHAPQVWYGTRAINEAIVPWSSAPVGSQYLRTDLGVWYQKAVEGTWHQIGTWAGPPLGLTARVVGDGGDYSSLSSALAAITDAAETNEYLLFVVDEIEENTTVAAKSHVHIIFLPGGSLNVIGGTHALTLASVSNVTIAAVNPGKPSIIRTGSSSSNCNAIHVQGSSSNIFLVGVYAQNNATGMSSGYGIELSSSANVTAEGCTFEGANALHGHGAYLFGSTMTATRCTMIGKGSSIGYGLSATDSTVTLRNCIIRSNGTSVGYGVYVQGGTNTLLDCDASGSASATNGHGLYLTNGAVLIQGGRYTGQGATGYGIYPVKGRATAQDALFLSTATSGARGGYLTLAGVLQAQRCLFAGSAIPNSVGLYVDANGLALLSDCVLLGGGLSPVYTSASVGASTRQEDARRPATSQPYRLLAAYINVVTAAAAGVTLTLRTASGGGGNVIAGPVAVDSTGDKQLPITGHYVLNANSDFYARLSAVDSTLAYTIYYVYEHAPGSCYALYNDSLNACIFQNCSFFSNSASAAIYVTSNGDDQSRFIGGIAASGLNSATRSKAMVCQSAWSSGRVYNMVLDGGSTNLTAAAGTVNGSNVEV